MMSKTFRFSALAATSLFMWVSLLVPILAVQTTYAAAMPLPQPVPKESCPGKVVDRYGQCRCPKDMTALDCTALLGQWQNWVPEKILAKCAAGENTTGIVIGNDNIKAAFLYFIQRGLTPQQSAGIVGNLQAESGVNPDINEQNPLVAGSRGGYGIAQWTGGRRVAIEKYAADNGKDLKSLQFQLDYLYDVELMGPYKINTLDPIRRTATVREASNVFLFKFERPADQGIAVQNKRAAYGEKILELFGAEAGTVSPVSSQPGAGTGCGTTGADATFVGFPLRIDKATIARLNGGCLPDGAQKMCQGGHPYTAYDIMAPTNTPVLSLLEGQVITVTTDKCPGRIVSVYNAAQDVTVSYLHMSIGQTMVTNGQQVTAGQQIGVVGTLNEGCNSPHLHIDAAIGRPRPGCQRENCPAANAAKFQAGNDKINLGGGLYTGYKALQ